MLYKLTTIVYYGYQSVFQYIKVYYLFLAKYLKKMYLSVYLQLGKCLKVEILLNFSPNTHQPYPPSAIS